MRPTTPLEVCETIASLKSKSSSSLDNISNKLLKQMSHVLSYPLSIVFNKSMSTGVYPDSLKLADVTPFYKNGSRNESTNYRPISLLITISKIFEKLIHKCVYTFLDTNSQIYQSQYGFWMKHSCEHAVQELLGSILKGRKGNSILLQFSWICLRLLTQCAVPNLKLLVFYSFYFNFSLRTKNKLGCQFF